MIIRNGMEKSLYFLKTVRMKTTTLFLILFSLLFLIGCEEHLTKAQWDIRYNPQTIEQAQAKAELEIKLKESERQQIFQARIDWLKTGCIVLIYLSVLVVIFAEGRLRHNGVDSLISLTAILAFMELYQQFQFWFSVLGGIVALAVGIIAIWYHRKELFKFKNNLHSS